MSRIWPSSPQTSSSRSRCSVHVWSEDRWGLTFIKRTALRSFCLTSCHQMHWKVLWNLTKEFGDAKSGRYEINARLRSSRATLLFLQQTWRNPSGKEWHREHVRQQRDNTHTQFRPAMSRLEQLDKWEWFEFVDNKMVKTGEDANAAAGYPQRGGFYAMRIHRGAHLFFLRSTLLVQHVCRFICSLAEGDWTQLFKRDFSKVTGAFSTLCKLFMYFFMSLLSDPQTGQSVSCWQGGKMIQYKLVNKMSITPWSPR